MDFPVFEFPWIGTRGLIALVAVLHVVINHGAAVGGSWLVVWLEHRGERDEDPRYETLAYRLAGAFFLLTTTLGALSGVGIWFTTMVGSPAGVASLLHIFFWAWFVEWVVFVVEVGLILAYFLSWHSFSRKRDHLRLGYAYAAASFATMVIVTGVLGAMLTPGQWTQDHAFWSGFLNPTYLPQLVLRTGLSLALAASFSLVLARWLAPRDFQAEASRFLARFLLAAVPLAGLGGAWYLAVLPAAVKDLIPTALMTTRFTPYVQASCIVNAVLSVALLGAGLWAWRSRPSGRGLPMPVRCVTLVASIALLGQFERVREFVRKPYLIPGHMYANGLRVADRAMLDRDGVLAHATYAPLRRITPANRLEAGHAVFRLECASCHTLGGLNDLTTKVAGVPAASLDVFIAGMHEARPFMPPFMGTAAERAALAAFLASEAGLRAHPLEQADARR